jgi:hypothetical protein
VASDLRFITIASSWSPTSSGCGDLGVNICERVLELNEEPPMRSNPGMLLMGERAESMVRDAPRRLRAARPERAQQVIARDKVVTASTPQMVRGLLTYMMEDPRNIYRATRLQSIAKYLERIGDHATNVAEMVVFMVKVQETSATWAAAGPSAFRSIRHASIARPFRRGNRRSTLAERSASRSPSPCCREIPRHRPISMLLSPADDEPRDLELAGVRPGAASVTSPRRPMKVETWWETAVAKATSSAWKGRS